MKLGTITGDDVIMLHKKYGPNWPDGGAIINSQKSENFERPPPNTVSQIDLKFDTHLQLNVLYKKAS